MSRVPIQPKKEKQNTPQEADDGAPTVEKCDEVETPTVQIEHVKSITTYIPPPPPQQIIRVSKPEKPIILKDDIFKQVAQRRRLEKEQERNNSMVFEEVPEIGIPIE